jgi:hypothetical protein
MSMKFDPNAATEAPRQTSFEPFPAGFYDFEVETAEEAVSRAGNEMLKLKVLIFNDAGHKRVVFEYLLSNQTWKIKAFAEAVGALDAYERGELEAEMMAGRTGRAKVGIEPAQNGYEAKNKVVAYIAGKAAPAPSRRTLEMASQAKAHDLDDSIPF